MCKTKNGEANCLAQTNSEGNDTFNENKKVEIFGTFNKEDSLCYTFEFDVDYNSFFGELTKPILLSLEQLKINSLNELIRLKEVNNRELFLENLINFIRCESHICGTLNRCQYDVFAFYIYIDDKQLSESHVDFICPKHLEVIRSSDYSIIEPIQEPTENLNKDELMLLIELILLSKEVPDSIICVPNEHFLELPIEKNDDLDWVAKTLGKFEKLKLIRVGYFFGLTHRCPVRNIIVKNIDAEEMASLLPESFESSPSNTIRN